LIQNLKTKDSSESNGLLLRSGIIKALGNSPPTTKDKKAFPKELKQVKQKLNDLGAGTYF